MARRKKGRVSAGEWKRSMNSEVEDKSLAKFMKSSWGRGLRRPKKPVKSVNSEEKKVFAPRPLIHLLRSRHESAKTDNTPKNLSTISQFHPIKSLKSPPKRKGSHSR